MQKKFGNAKAISSDMYFGGNKDEVARVVVWVVAWVVARVVAWVVARVVAWVVARVVAWVVTMVVAWVRIATARHGTTELGDEAKSAEVRGESGHFEFRLLRRGRPATPPFCLLQHRHSRPPGDQGRRETGHQQGSGPLTDAPSLQSHCCFFIAWAWRGVRMQC